MSKQTKQATLATRYQQAIESLVEKARQDRRVLAAILYGSLSYDQVWEGSDIDLWLVMTDDKLRENSHCLIENGIIIHANLVNRNQFKRRLQSSQQGGWQDFTFARSTLLFSKDESLADWYRDAAQIGDRDRDIRLVNNANSALAFFGKTKKYCQLKKDYRYSFLWLTYTVERLAAIECLLHGEAPGREVIHQGLEFNPDFFNAVYTNLMDQKKTKKNLSAAIDLVEAYLAERATTIFKPILDYFEDADGPRSLSELRDHFAKVELGESDWSCEWLAAKGYLEKMSSPIHLTEKSRIHLEEPAYYADGEGAIF